MKTMGMTNHNTEFKQLRRENEFSDMKKAQQDMMSLANYDESDTSRGDDGFALAAEVRAIQRDNDRSRRRSDHELSYALDGMGRRY